MTQVIRRKECIIYIKYKIQGVCVLEGPTVLICLGLSQLSTEGPMSQNTLQFQANCDSLSLCHSSTYVSMSVEQYVCRGIYEYVNKTELIYFPCLLQYKLAFTEMLMPLKYIQNILLLSIYCRILKFGIYNDLVNFT